MQSMVERWMNTLKNSQRKSQHTKSTQRPTDIQIPPPQPQNNLNSSNKKSAKKKKNQDGHRNQTPPRTSKSYHTETPHSLKHKTINDFIQRIQSVKGSDSHRHLHIILEQFWSIAQSFCEPQEPLSQVRDAPSKIQAKIHLDLQNKYFNVQKQKQSLKYQLQEAVKKHQGVQRENGRLLKSEKLLDNCMRREESLNKEIEFLRAQLRGAEEKEREQQKIFKKEVMAIYGLIEAVKESLPG